MLITQRPIISHQKITDSRYKFTIEPLEPGFGYTLGNSLRRALLSSIPGAAVTSVKINGVHHEFEVKEGIKEDIAEVILNIKNLVVSSDNNDPVTIWLTKDEPGVITAGDIKTSSGIEIHNKDMHIATLSKGTLEMELVVERGRGYVSADNNKKLNPNIEVDRIIVDSIYSPVLKVAFSVDATRVGQHTNFDKLVLDVETKPSISPLDAIASAGKTLTGLFGLVSSLNEEVEGIEIGEKIVDFGPSDNTNIDESIEMLDLPQRAYNNLRHNKILTIGELIQATEKDLLGFSAMGRTSVEKIKEALRMRGLELTAESNEQ
jgi:DNA-directed RNA polymerase subunit alpha